MTGRYGLLWAVAVGLLSRAAVAAEEPGSDPNVAFMMSTVQAYKAEIGNSLERELTLHPRPILKWTNPVSGIEHGALVLWHDQGRPAVIAQVFKIPAPNLFWLHEVQSVTTEPLQFSLPQKTVWSTKLGGAKFQPLKMIDPPADKPAARLTQARAISRRFTPSEDFRIAPSDPVSKFELRLVTQPVYQYQSEKLAVSGGYVFAYVNGTDPEVMLILEAFADKSGPGWRYILCPMTCWGVAAKWDGETVWSVDEQYGKTTIRDPYAVWRVDESLVADDPTAVSKPAK